MNKTLLATLLGSLLLLWTACQKETNAPTPTNPTNTGGSVYNLIKFAGNNQTDTINKVLNTPLKAKVQDSLGVAIQGIPVTFTVSSGGGMLSVTIDTTDADGFVESIWTLGSDVGAQTVTISANVTGLNTQTFSAIGLARVLQSPYIYTSSWGSLGTSNPSLNRPTKIVATDAYVFINDNGNGKLKKFDHNGVFLDALDFSNPFYVYDNLLYVVSDTNRNYLLAYDFNLNLVNSYLFPTALPTNGDISGNNQKALLTKNTTSQPFLMSLNLIALTTNSFGNLGTGALAFQWNGTFAVSYENGNYFVTDGGNYRVQKLDANYAYMAEYRTDNHSVLNSPNVMNVNADYTIISNYNNASDEVDFYDRNTNAFLFEMSIGSYFKRSIATNQNKLFILVDHPMTEVRVYTK